MVFNVTFNNISIISWRSVLLVAETGVPWENHRPARLVEKQQIPILVFCLTRTRLKPMIYLTWGEHAPHYINNVCSPLHQQCTLPITSTMYAPHYINNVRSPLHQQCMLPITSTMYAPHYINNVIKQLLRRGFQCILFLTHFLTLFCFSKSDLSAFNLCISHLRISWCWLVFTILKYK
jgi:hypothetical protein